MFRTCHKPIIQWLIYVYIDTNGNQATSFMRSKNILNFVMQFKTYSFYLLDQGDHTCTCQIILSVCNRNFCLLTPPHITWHQSSSSRSGITSSFMRSFKTSVLRCCWSMTNLKHLVGRVPQPIRAERARSSSSYALRLQIDFWACWWRSTPWGEGWMDGK